MSGDQRSTNTITAVADAFYDSIPLVVFTGQVPLNLIGNDAFQEVDIVGMTRGITKYSVTVRDRKELGKILKMEEKTERWSCIFSWEIYNKSVTVQYLHCYITPEKYRYRNRINSERKIMKKNRWEQTYREGGSIMRNMEFKMERQGLLTVGQEVDVTESALPTSYYYTIQPMIAMSKNYPGYERLQSRKGIVKDIKETDRGYYTVVEFDEEDIGN